LKLDTKRANYPFEESKDNQENKKLKSVESKSERVVVIESDE
jgi:hypothetical protein